MNNQIKISIMEPFELPKVACLFTDSWQRTYPSIVPEDYLAILDYKKAEEMWGEYVKKEGQFILVAHNASQIIGMAAAQTAFELPDTGYLAALHVEASQKGKGVGKALIKAVADELRHRAIFQLALAVIEGNDNALTFYKHIGGKVVDFRENREEFISKEYIFVWDDTSVLLAI